MSDPELTGYAHNPRRFSNGNRLRLLRSGSEAYPAMLETIGAARRCVHLETYILRADSTGVRFADALCEKAAAGVPVRLMFDALGSLGLADSYVDRLRSAGVRVLAYRPVAPWRPRWGLWRRNHRKTLIVDGKIGYSGGLNIGNEYGAIDEGGGGWLDLHLRIEGPAAAKLEGIFRETWHSSGGEPYAPSDVPPRAGDVLAAVIANEDHRSRFRIRRSYLHAIRHARSTIRILNAYFIPDAGVRWALRRAARRGVDVRVIVPSVPDVLVAQYASMHLYGRLLRAGVHIHRWPGPMMHAKAAVIDRTWCAIGSYNLDYRSLLHDLEAIVAVLDRGFGQCLHDRVEEDLAACRALTVAEWRARPKTQRILEWLAYRVRRWL